MLQNRLRNLATALQVSIDTAVQHCEVLPGTGTQVRSPARSLLGGRDRGRIAKANEEHILSEKGKAGEACIVDERNELWRCVRSEGTVVQSLSVIHLC